MRVNQSKAMFIIVKLMIFSACYFQIELERLNTATDEINRLEVELDEARLAFRRLLAEGHLRIQQLTKKLGTSVHKARPYYEARFRANIVSNLCLFLKIFLYTYITYIFMEGF